MGHLGTVVEVAQAMAIRRRVRDDLIRLVHRSPALPDLARRATTLVRRAVPGDGTCLLTLDPATLVPTGEFVDTGLSPDATARLAEIEQREPDYNKFADLARRPTPAASLSEATRGHLDRSVRQRDVRAPSGFGDELRVALADDTGTWGALTVLRGRDRPDFSTAEVRFAASVAGVLAEGVQRALLDTPAIDAEPVAPGLLVLAPDGTRELADQAADHWLDALGTGEAPALPTAVRAVADRARGGDHDHGLARARVRTPQGQWLTIRGSLLGEGPDARVAIQLEAARAPELAPLVVAAYGFTERERAITELVARGYPTSEIAARLHLSAYTVQDHLKSIFDKSGTSSRAELVARLFLDHHGPNLTLGNPGSLPG